MISVSKGQKIPIFSSTGLPHNEVTVKIIITRIITFIIIVIIKNIITMIS